MAGAANKVIAGEYEKKQIVASGSKVYISKGFMDRISLDHTTVAAYELITDEHRKSAKSGAVRGLVGGALLGPVGLLAGGLSAKSKGIYQVVIQFKNGKRSLVEVDDKLYKLIIKNCF